MNGKIVVAVIAALVVPWIVAVISSGKMAGRQKGEFKVVEYGPLYVATMGLGFAFFTFLAGMAWAFPGKTNPTAIPYVILTFLSFAGMSLAALALARRSTLLWNERELEGADMTAKRHRLAWNELARIEYIPAATALRLSSHDGRRLWVSPLMRGFHEFCHELDRQARELGLPMPEIPEVALGPGPDMTNSHDHSLR